MTITELLRDVIETAGNRSGTYAVSPPAKNIREARALSHILTCMGFRTWVSQDASIVYKARGT